MCCHLSLCLAILIYQCVHFLLCSGNLFILGVDKCFPFEKNVYTLLKRHYMAYSYVKKHTSELTMVIGLCLYSKTQIRVSEAVVLQVPVKDMFSKLARWALGR